MLTELSEALLLTGRVEEASGMVDRLLDLCRTHTGRGWQAQALRYETRIFTCNAWMISMRHLRFSRPGCSGTELTRFTSVAFQLAMLC